MHHNLFCRPLACCLIALFSLPAVALHAQAPANDRIRESETRQQELQTQARNLSAEWSAMIADYERNGIAGDDTKPVKNLLALMSSLSDSDMKKVVELLQQARATKDPKAALQQVTEAYSGQKSISLSLKRALAEFQRKQEASAVAAALKDLTQRQTANLENAATLEKLKSSPKPEQYSDMIKASMEAQQSEEAALSEELKMAASKIDALAKDPESKELADRFKSALAQAQKLSPMLDAAAEALKQQNLADAMAKEKEARNQMRRLSRLVAPADKTENLRASADELAKMIEEQKAVVGEAETAAHDRNLDEWMDKALKDKNSVLSRALASGKIKTPAPGLRQDPDVQKMFKAGLDAMERSKRTPDLAALEKSAAALADRNQLLSEDLQTDAKPSADSLQNAKQSMEAARAALSQADAAAAAKNGKQALAAMQAAAAGLEQTLAQAKKGDANSDIAKLQDLQKRVQDTLAQEKQEAQKAAQPKTPEQNIADTKKQGELKKQTQQAQQQAAGPSPEVAATLAKAAATMQQAEAAIQNPMQRGQAAQAAANQLAKADQQLAAQIKKEEQQQAAAQAAAKADGALSAIIDAQQQLDIDTLKGAGKEEIKSLAPRQTELNKTADTFNKTLTPDPQAAAALAADALKSMSTAAALLKQANQSSADGAERKALESLYKLREALQQQAAMAQNPPPEQQANAAAQQAAMANFNLQRAQAQIAQAMNTMTPAATPAAMQQASNQLQSAASSVAAAQQASPPASGTPQQQKAMQGAQQSLAAAAQQAAQRDAAGAKASAAAAQQSLAQAQSATAQASAGIKPSSASAAGLPTGQPGQPGQASQPGQPGQPSQSGKPGAPGQAGQTAAESFQPKSNEGTTAATGGAIPQGRSQFLNLPPRDRAAIQQSQSEPYPEEYAPAIQQYMRNLATQSSK